MNTTYILGCHSSSNLIIHTSRVGLEKAAKILEKIELDINKML